MSFKKDLLEKFLFGLRIRQIGASPSSGFHFTYEHYESRLSLLLGCWSAQCQMRVPFVQRKLDISDGLGLFLSTIFSCYTKQIVVMHFSKFFWIKKGGNMQLIFVVVVVFSLMISSNNDPVATMKPWKLSLTLLPHTGTTDSAWTPSTYNCHYPTLGQQHLSSGPLQYLNWSYSLFAWSIVLPNLFSELQLCWQLYFGLRLQSKLLKRPLKSLENLKWACFHIPMESLLLKSTMFPPPSFGHLCTPFPLPWTPLFHSPGFYLVLSSQCKRSVFRGKFS